MEVKEIIEYLEKHKPIPLFARSKEDYNEYIGKDIEKIDKMITLLKSLESENKKYKNILKELEQARTKRIAKNISGVIDGFEKQYPESIIKSLESENKALKQENKAYKGMWKELKPTDDYECLILEERHLLSKMGNLENKYLGGGE